MHRLQRPLELRTLSTAAAQHGSATPGQLKHHLRTSIERPASDGRYTGCGSCGRFPWQTRGKHASTRRTEVPNHQNAIFAGISQLHRDTPKSSRRTENRGVPGSSPGLADRGPIGAGRAPCGAPVAGSSRTRCAGRSVSGRCCRSACGAFAGGLESELRDILSTSATPSRAHAGHQADSPAASYSSCRRHHAPVSLRPSGARSSHWYMPQRPSRPRA
jgi:hypothetical protein